MKIAIEGMDGVGKTTVSKKLSQKLGYVHYEQKMIDHLGMDKNLYNNLVNYVRSSNNRKMSALFYTFRLMIDNSDNINSIVERSIVSMVYYEKDNINEKILDTIMDLEVIPDLTLILYAPVEKRIERIKKRDPNDPDLNSEEALQDGYDIMLDFVHNYDIPYIGIDTTNYSEDTVVEICKEIVLSYEKCPEEKKKVFLDKMNDTYGFDKLYEKKGKVLCKKKDTM